MSARSFLVILLAACSADATAFAQGPAPVGDANPLPVLDAGGPTAAVTALAFSPDGQTLYSAGYDKVLRVWRRAAGGQFQPDPRATLRVPIGPGRDGVINVLAVSPDGTWVALSGLGVYRGAAGFGQGGYVVPEDTLTPEMRQERSLIYVFNTQTQAVALLRGHEEDVLALAFAPAQAGQPQLLVSAARTRGDRPAGRVLVWDVGRAATLNDKGELVDRGAKLHEWLIAGLTSVAGGPPPGLAVRRTPDGHARVAVAWGDGVLRVREFGPNGVTESVDEPQTANGRPAEYTHALAAAPGRLLTGGIVGGQGYVQAWDDAPGQPPRARGRVSLTPPRAGSYALPRAIALVSSGDGRGLDQAAVVLRSPPAQGVGQDYRLALVDLRTLRPVTRPDGDLPLGTSTIPPVVAASPDGRFLAVTGEQNRDIRVYVARDLLGQRTEPAPLRSVGTGVAAVTFARKGEPAELSLVLRPAGVAGQPSPIAPTDLVLDVGKRTLTPDPARQGWRPVSPADAGWRADHEAAAPADFRWTGPQGRGTARLKLRPSQVVTAYAVVPPRPPLADPVLAVATWDATTGEPQLALYHAGTGRQLRQLSGHVQPIRSLAATADGRLLASAADDQTICVWGLTDLAEVVGKHATVPGLTFRPGDRSAVVATAEAGPLVAGDEIRSLSFAGPDRKPREIASPLDLFAAVWDEKPGETVQVRVRRGGVDQTVPVRLEQGADERKPLVSLFVTGGQTPEWIAWSPLGPYDASGREVERYFGWHFNPPRLGEPVRFARADAYRERLHKPGLLKPLLAHANLTDALRELDRQSALPRATIQVAVDAAGPMPFGGAFGQLLVQQPRVTVHLRVQGPSVGKNEVESITWRLDGGAPRPMPLDRAAGESLTQPVDLGGRGAHRIQVCLRTREAEPQEVTRDVVLRYQPPPPVIRLKTPAEPRVTVRDAKFRFQAVVDPGSPGQKVAVTLRQGRGQPRPAGLQVDEAVTLAPGENVLELRAANEGALAGYEEFESDQRTVVLVFQPQAARQPAPRVTLETVQPLVPPGEPIKVESGRAVTVGAGKVRVRGRITAAAPLAAAQLGDRPLSGFQPNTVREFAVDEEVTLKPGGQELRFRAKTATSDEAEARLAVTYRPPLPVLTLTDPDPDRVLTEGQDEREVEVKGTLAPPEGLTPADVAPFDAVIRVTAGGRPAAQAGGVEAVTISSVRLAPPGALAAKVRIEPGDNRIDVILRNQWQEAAAVERHVYFRRPPRLVGALAASPPGEKPFTDVTAAVESASDLTRVECNGREYPVPDVAARAGEATWRVTIPQVPLVPGANPIRLVVGNRDGQCLEPGRADVKYTPPKPKSPPRVTLANRPQGAVKEPQFTARFVIRSEGSRVRRVELRQDSRVLAAVADPRQDQDGPDVFVATGDLGPVPLQEGANRLRLVAVNGGGEAGEAFAVSYLQTPEWLEIDRPTSPLPQAEFVLTGRVRWAGGERAADVERKVRGLRVYVNNGFQQQTPEYRPADANGLEFAVRVILNQERNNLVEVVCPDLRPDAGGLQRFTVDCDRPREEPRALHLLVVSIGSAPADAADKTLALRALKALEARGGGAAGLHSPVFQRVMMHPYSPDQPTPVLSGYVTCEHVRDALESIRRHSKPNDVALIYWRGEEAVDRGGALYLKTSETRPGTNLAHKAIALKELLEFPRDVPGACALLLDTAASHAQPEVPAAVPLPSTRVAVLRSAWSGQGAAVPGLLQALEEAARTRKATKLKDLAAVADRERRQYAVVPAWEDNLKDLPALADLVISRRP